MPTGYTFKLYESDQSFADFVWTCAKPFVKTMTAATSPLDTLLDVESVTRGLVLKQAEAELAHWQSMDPQDASLREKLESDYRQEVRDFERRASEEATRKARFRAMEERVNEWRPPTPEHQKLKDFMLEQLAFETQFEPYYTEDKRPVRKTPEEYIGERIRWTKNLVDHYASQMEGDGNLSMKKWLEDLNRSVPHPGRPPTRS